MKAYQLKAMIRISELKKKKNSPLPFIQNKGSGGWKLGTVKR